MMAARVYLDWNATAPLRKSAGQAACEALDCVGNPSSAHQEGRQARAIVEKARRQVANLCGVEPDCLVFTSGATEAASLLLADRDLKSAPVEHPAVLAWTKSCLPVDSTGHISVSNPNESTVQIANSETGRLQQLTDGIRVTDATQALGKIDVKAEIAAADYAFVSGHKIGAPKGVGAVICNSIGELRAQLQGGGQEFNRRAGTENLPGIAGFGAAAEEALGELNSGRWEEVESLRNKLDNMLKEAAQDITIYAEYEQRLPNTTCFTTPGWKGVTQVMVMDLHGFAVSAGAACSSGKLRSRNALHAMGVSSDLADCALRLSIGPSTSLNELENFVVQWSRLRHGIGSG